MDRQVIEQKLESLRLCIARVREKAPATVAELVGDADAQDVITLNLTRAVQLCVDIGAHVISGSAHPAPDTMGKTFDTLAEMKMIEAELALRLKKAVGFRNIAIHNYEAIDWQITHLIATRHIGDFTSFAAAVVDFVGRQENNAGRSS